MATDFDRAMEELQQQVIEQARALYSDKVIDEVYNPKNLGRMRNPDTQGLVHGWCGDTMEFYLRLEGERIGNATFVTDGCWPTVACGSMMTTIMLVGVYGTDCTLAGVGWAAAVGSDE